MAVTDYGIPLAVGGKTKTLSTVLYSSVAGQLQFGKGSVIGACLLVPAVLAFLFDSGRRRDGDRVLRGICRRPAAECGHTAGASAFHTDAVGSRPGAWPCLCSGI